MPQDGIAASPGLPFVPPVPRRRPPAVPNAVLAVTIAVAVEAMFFAGLISAFVVVKAGIKPGMWPPPWQPRLPVEETAVNTAILLVSGVLFLLAGLGRAKKPRVASLTLYVLAGAGGVAFVALQGVEWAGLLGQGLTMQSSNHGAFFYLIVGIHALHAIAGIAALGWGLWRLMQQRLTRPQLLATQIYWTFVVGLWPILYTLVYL